MREQGDIRALGCRGSHSLSSGGRLLVQEAQIPGPPSPAQPLQAGFPHANERAFSARSLPGLSDICQRTKMVAGTRKGLKSISQDFFLPNRECHQDRPRAFFTFIFLALSPRPGKEKEEINKPYFPDIHLRALAQAHLYHIKHLRRKLPQGEERLREAWG